MGAKCCKTDKQEEERLRRALLLQQTSSTLLDRYASLSPQHPSTRPQSSVSTTQQEYSTRSPTPGIRRTQSTQIPQDYYRPQSSQSAEFNFRSSSNTIYPLHISEIRSNADTLPRNLSRSPSAPPRKSRKLTGSSGFFEEFSTSSYQQVSSSSNPPTHESVQLDAPPATPPRRRRKDSSASASSSKRVSEIPQDLPPTPPVREVSTKRKIRTMTLIKDGAPAFVRNLTDVAVKVGTRTRLLAEIEPNVRDQDEVMKVSWFRNDQKISFPTDGTSRIRQTSEGRFHYLDISPVLTDDEGKWICLAENFHGRTSSNCSVKVMVPKSYRPPEFVESLKAVLTEAGTVSLECKVIGTPTPLLKWYKDGVEIKAGDIFALRGDASSLGVYTCEATNCMGSVTSSSRVHMNEGGSSPLPGSIQITSSLLDSRVRVGEKIEFQLQINKQFDETLRVNWYNKNALIPSSERVQQITNSSVCVCTINPVEVMDDGEWTCEIVSASNEKVRIANSCVLSILIPRNYRKPKFLEDLKAILTEEGLVSFECKVCGFPTPILHWYKDGYELKPGDVYQLSGANSLGRYSCVAHNCMGDAESSTELTLEDIQHQLSDDERKQLIAEGIASKRPPKFVKGLKSIEVKIGEPCNLQVQLNDMKSTVSWFRDSVCVDTEERYVLRNEGGGVHTLLIQELEFDDQAEWKCTGTNEYGHSVSTAGLKLVIPSTFKKPKFLESLRAVLSEEGTVNLECKVIGVPVPVLKWYKDGVELKAGDIHRIISGADGTCCLGTYTCVAKNCMGEVSSSAALLGFEDKLEKDAQQKQDAQRAANLTRDPSLSTIMEERTSQMMSIYETPASALPRSIEEEDHARAGAADISVSIDGKDVSVSLYETPDLTENDAKQIIEMFANEYSEYISEHNVVPLPSLRFVKETSTSGNIVMEAVLIDVPDTEDPFDTAKSASMGGAVIREDPTEADYDDEFSDSFESPMELSATSELAERGVRSRTSSLREKRKHSEQSLSRRSSEKKRRSEERASQQPTAERGSIAKEDATSVYLSAASDNELDIKRATPKSEIEAMSERLEALEEFEKLMSQKIAMGELLQPYEVQENVPLSNIETLKMDDERLRDVPEYSPMVGLDLGVCEQQVLYDNYESFGSPQPLQKEIGQIGFAHHHEAIQQFGVDPFSNVGEFEQQLESLKQAEANIFGGERFVGIEMAEMVLEGADTFSDVDSIPGTIALEQMQTSEGVLASDVVEAWEQSVREDVVEEKTAAGIVAARKKKALQAEAQSSQQTLQGVQMPEASHSGAGAAEETLVANKMRAGTGQALELECQVLKKSEQPSMENKREEINVKGEAKLELAEEQVKSVEQTETLERKSSAAKQTEGQEVELKAEESQKAVKVEEQTKSVKKAQLKRGSIQETQIKLEATEKTQQAIIDEVEAVQGANKAENVQKVSDGKQADDAKTNAEVDSAKQHDEVQKEKAGLNATESHQEKSAQDDNKDVNRRQEEKEQGEEDIKTKPEEGKSLKKLKRNQEEEGQTKLVGVEKKSDEIAEKAKKAEQAKEGKSSAEGKEKEDEKTQAEAKMKEEELMKQAEAKTKSKETKGVENEEKAVEEAKNKSEIGATKTEDKKRDEESKKAKEEDNKNAEEEKKVNEEAAKKKADDANKVEEEKKKADANKKAEEEVYRKAEAEKMKSDQETKKKVEEEKKKCEDEATKKAEEAKKQKAEEEAKKKAEETKKKAEEEKKNTEEEAKKKADAAKKKAEEEKQKAEDEAKNKAEIEAKKKAEEAKRKVEEEEKKKAAEEEEAKKKAEDDKKQKAEEEATKKADEAKKQKAEDEAKKKAEEAKKKAEDEAKKKAEDEKKKAEDEAKKKAEEAKRKTEEEEKKKADEAKKKAEEAKKKAEESKRKTEEEEKKKAAEEEEAKKKAEEDKQEAKEEAKKKADEEAKKKADEEAKKKADEEAKKKADEEAKKKADEEAKKKADEEAKKKADEESKKKADEESKKKADEETKQKKAAEEAKKKKAEEDKKKADEDAKKAEEEKKKAAEEAKKLEEEKKKKPEEEAKKLEDEKKKKAAEEAKKLEEEKKKKAAEEAKKLEDEKKKKAEEEAKKLEDEKKKKAEEEKKKANEETKQKAADEKKKKADEDAKKAEEEKKKTDEDAKKKAEEDKKKADEDAKKAKEEAKKAEEEKKKKAEDEKKKKAEEEAKKKAENEDKKKAEDEAKKKAEEDKKQKAEEEAKKKADEDKKKKAEEEKQKKAEEEKKKKAEEEAKKAEEEKKKKAEEEAKKAEEEKKKKAEEEAKKAEDEKKKKAAEDAKKKAEEEKKKADEDAKKKADEEAKQKAADEKKKKAAEDAKKKADEDAKKKAEDAKKVEVEKKSEEEAKKAEEKKKADEDAKKKAEEEAKKAEEKKKADEDAKKKAEEEAKKAEEKKKADEDAKKKAEEEAKKAEEKKKADENAKKKAEEEAKKVEEEKKKKADEDAKKVEEEKKKKAEDEKKKKADEDAKKKADEEAKKKKADEEANNQKAEDEKKKKADEEAKKKADEAMKLEDEKRKRADEDAKKKVEDSKKPAADAKKAEEESKKPTADAKKMEEDAKKPAADAKKAEEESKKSASDAKKAEDLKGKEGQDEGKKPGEPGSKRSSLDDNTFKIKTVKKVNKIELQSLKLDGDVKVQTDSPSPTTKKPASPTDKDKDAQVKQDENNRKESISEAAAKRKASVDVKKAEEVKLEGKKVAEAKEPATPDRKDSVKEPAPKTPDRKDSVAAAKTTDRKDSVKEPIKTPDRKDSVKEPSKTPDRKDSVKETTKTPDRKDSVKEPVTKTPDRKDSKEATKTPDRKDSKEATKTPDRKESVAAAKSPDRKDSVKEPVGPTPPAAKTPDRKDSVKETASKPADRKDSVAQDKTPERKDSTTSKSKDSGSPAKTPDRKDSTKAPDSKEATPPSRKDSAKKEPAKKGVVKEEVAETKATVTKVPVKDEAPGKEAAEQLVSKPPRDSKKRDSVKSPEKEQVVRKTQVSEAQESVVARHTEGTSIARQHEKDYSASKKADATAFAATVSVRSSTNEKPDYKSSEHKPTTVVTSSYDRGTAGASIYDKSSYDKVSSSYDRVATSHDRLATSSYDRLATTYERSTALDRGSSPSIQRTLDGVDTRPRTPHMQDHAETTYKYNKRSHEMQPSYRLSERAKSYDHLPGYNYGSDTFSADRGIVVCGGPGMRPSSYVPTISRTLPRDYESPQERSKLRSLEDLTLMEQTHQFSRELRQQQVKAIQRKWKTTDEDSLAELDELPSHECVSPPPAVPPRYKRRNNYQVKVSSEAEDIYGRDIVEKPTFQMPSYFTTPSVGYSYFSMASLSSAGSFASLDEAHRLKRPRFSMKLSSRTTSENTEVVKFACTVFGTPDPSVQWYKNGLPIFSDRQKYVITTNCGVCSLDIHNLEAHDTGEYTCFARNFYGKAASSAILKVEGISEQRKTLLPELTHGSVSYDKCIPVNFTTGIMETNFPEVNELVLECQVKGNPRPEIMWMKNGQSIIAYGQTTYGRFRADYANIFETGKCRLIIQRPRESDSGVYTCVGRNYDHSAVGRKLCWSDEITKCVNVKGGNTSPKGLGSMIMSQNFEYQAPRFITELEPFKHVHLGREIVLTVEVAGVPNPEVRWFHHKNSIYPIKQSSHTRVVNESPGIHTLYIPETDPFDFGTYTVRVTNKYGMVESSCSITEVVAGINDSPTLSGLSKRKSFDSQNVAPTFVREPRENILLKYGDELVIECDVEGWPQVTVNLYRGCRNVILQPRAYKELTPPVASSSSNTRQKVKFTLTNLHCTDFGMYTVEAKNIVAVTKAFVNVKVLDPEGGLRTPRSMTPSSRRASPSSSSHYLYSGSTSNLRSLDTFLPTTRSISTRSLLHHTTYRPSSSYRKLSCSSHVLAREY